MDRLSQLRGEAGGSGDSTLDTTSPPSEAYMSANENSSKYFSFDDSTFDISPIKDVPLASTSADAECSTSDGNKLISNLSPIEKKDSYKIGTQIEAANILSGGVDIFDDNENSFDGDELVIDDNVEADDKANDIADAASTEEIVETAPVEAALVEEVVDVPSSVDIVEVDPAGDIEVAPVEEVEVAPAENIEVAPVEDVEVAPAEDIVDGVPAVDIVDPAPVEDIPELEPAQVEPELVEEVNEDNRETEVVLQIDGNNVDAINIGNGLYLYRKDGEDELAAIQIIDDNNPQHSFKFLKVRDNAEGNLEVYEEIEIEVPKDVPAKEGKPADKKPSNVPDADPNNVPSCSSSNKSPDSRELPQKEPVASTSKCQDWEEKDTSPESKAEVNVNGKVMKFSESRKSPVVGSFTPMTYHSTPNKEGKPLTKTMVDLQLHPNRHSDNVKKTIEVHTDNVKQKSSEKEKEPADNAKAGSTEKGVSTDKTSSVTNKPETKEQNVNNVTSDKSIEENQSVDAESNVNAERKPKSEIIDKKIDSITVEVHNKDAKTSKKNDSSVVKIKLDKGKRIVRKTDNSTIKINESAVVFDKPDETVVVPTSVTTNNTTTISSTVTVNSVCNEITKTYARNPLEPTKPVCINIDKDEVPCSSKLKTNSKTEPVKSMVMKDMPTNEGTIEKVTVDEIKPVDSHNFSKLKEVEGDSTKTPGLSNTYLKQAPIAANVESSMTSDDDIIKFPLENFSDVSSTSTTIQSEESKAESITLYAIDTDESVSLITPSSTTNTRKDNLDNNISDVLAKTNNIPNAGTMLIVKTAIDKQNSKVSLPNKKESSLGGKDHVDSTTKTTHGSHSFKLAEHPKVLEKRNNQKVKNSSETKRYAVPAPGGAMPSVALPKGVPSEKSAGSIPVSIVKPDNTKQSIPVPKVKPSDKAVCLTNSIVPKKPLAKETHRVIPEVKSSEKGRHSIFDGEPLQKSSHTGFISGINTSETLTRLTPVLEVKNSEKSAQSTLVANAKLTEKTKNAIPVVKTLEITSTESIKTAKPESHVPIVTIANKTSIKLIPQIPKIKNEDIKKANEKAVNQKDILKSNSVDKNSTHIKKESQETKEPTNKSSSETKPVNNNHTPAVPFGKWTDVNRQEFLNKFKEVKAPVNSNSKQIKNSNDLNRRDVLQKIDSQRAQTIINNAVAKAQEKTNIKNEAVFSNKVQVLPSKSETKQLIKSENTDVKPKQVPHKVPTKQEDSQITVVTSTVPTNLPEVATVATVSKTEPAPRDLSTATMASLIDKTIEDMINRVVPCKSVADEPTQMAKINASEPESTSQIVISTQDAAKPVDDDPVSLDDIEMKMNELHGIPFVERPPHELPKIPKAEIKTYSKVEKNKVSNKIPTTPHTISNNELKKLQHNVVEIDSEEEVIEHEPITGDLELNKKTVSLKSSPKDKKPISEKSVGSVVSKVASDKETIITETDFDKFARRNSVSCENYLTVNFDRKEPQKVSQKAMEKELVPKVNPKPEPIRIEAKSTLPHKPPVLHNTQTDKSQNGKFGAVTVDSSNKKYQSKIHTAYQSALTAKHQVARPISIIEDKPVKVIFVESNAEFVPSQLNVQGKELSPAKKPVTELNAAATLGNDSVDTDMLDVIDENKRQDKKTKHQRKQVLTPVEAPDLELIQPSDIGLESSPKKKRRLDDVKIDKQAKNLVHKKSYLLGRNTVTEDKTTHTQVLTKDAAKDIVHRNEDVKEHKDTASAIDNLVKAAELLDNQAETLNKSVTPLPDNQANTPVKRGRGRPRKYPLPEGTADSKTPSPQKKPRLIDAKPVKRDSISDDQDADTSDEEMVRENWTMGKINENIVCPICNKLFRSENVVFKHVKHCTGESPNRSDSDKRSPRRSRLSQESEDFDTDYEMSVSETKKTTPKKRRSKENLAKVETKPEQTKLEADKDDVIVIEDTSIKEKPEKHDKEKDKQPKKLLNAKVPHTGDSLVCEFCGKTFRQLSYLVSHKLQHNKDKTKRIENDAKGSIKLPVFSCEVCKKEFRKLHHLVQHRIIHNPDSVPKRTLRKSSSEQKDIKNIKEDAVAKQNEDPSAAFRCEPCDKSFRKLHHLVEHRETHDGINRQKPSAVAQPTVEKTSPPPQCEICKKTFRKLHHLIEHKEQHADTSSEKSDDKSVQSALSTKDIIHECSLCYMVFPNEHSLTKHSVNCSKKKRQSKQPKDVTDNESVIDEQKLDDQDDDAPKIVTEGIDGAKILEEQDSMIVVDSPEVVVAAEVEKPTVIEITQLEDEKPPHNAVVEKPLQNNVEVKSIELRSTPAKRDLTKTDVNKVKEKSVVPEKIKKIDHKEVKTQEVPKKKTPLKDKVASTVTKRQKTIDEPTANVINEVIPPIESSDDEVRYMFNPKFKLDESTEGKIFMKVRASKRNSLQIERPSSKDLVTRRTSLQHPPKVIRPKLRAVKPKLKAVEPKPKVLEPVSDMLATLKHNAKKSQTEATLSTDSDDSDVKYSFPKTAPETSKSAKDRTTKGTEKKISRKSVAEKRQSLTGIAKRKSLGKAITAKHKINDLPAKPIKKRSAQAEHRCDCGQLFSSAALLARHTSLAHTPPRIRRRRSPPPPPPPPPPAPKPNAKPHATGPGASTRKSSVKSDATTPASARRAADQNKSQTKGTAVKTRRSAAFTGIPIPDKMRKLLEKDSKK